MRILLIYSLLLISTLASAGDQPLGRLRHTNFAITSIEGSQDFQDGEVFKAILADRLKTSLEDKLGTNVSFATHAQILLHTRMVYFDLGNIYLSHSLTIEDIPELLETSISLNGNSHEFKTSFPDYVQLGEGKLGALPQEARAFPSVVAEVKDQFLDVTPLVQRQVEGIISLAEGRKKKAAEIFEELAQVEKLPRAAKILYLISAGAIRESLNQNGMIDLEKAKEINPLKGKIFSAMIDVHVARIKRALLSHDKESLETNKLAIEKILSENKNGLLPLAVSEPASEFLTDLKAIIKSIY